MSTEKLDDLVRTLAEIESYHGMIQAANDYRHVKNLHEKARAMLESLRQQEKQLHALVDRSYTLLSAIAHPFRPIERSDVQQWLIDAQPVVELNH